MYLKKIVCSLCLLLASVWGVAQTVFSVADVFNDHMVIQQQANVKIWGTATDNTSVEVVFNGQKTTAKVSDGKWMAILKPMPHGGPYEMIVKNGMETKTFRDVYIGEVWLAGGQSNMAFTLHKTKNAQQEINNADYPLIRYYTVNQKRRQSFWQTCSPLTISNFSAVAYYFARNLYKELNVPIGIINCSVGGTKAEAWMSREAFENNKSIRFIIEKHDRNITADGNKKNNNHPTGFFNEMLTKVIPYTLKGFIFYQGEANCHKAAQYREIFPALIQDWRMHWGQEYIPFLFIQLPKYKVNYWAELRESQQVTAQTVKNTGMVVSFDQGDTQDIHPIVKDTVAWRLSSLALGKVYGKKIVCQSPDFKQATRTKNGFCVEFNHIGSGLVTKDKAENVLGFTIAGKNGEFYPAKAVIKNNKVWLTCDNVKEPEYVRYLWVSTGQMNLFNKDGFPAAPFRTDRFPLLTDNGK